MSNSLLSYDGYHAEIHYDNDDSIFIGTVIGMSDSLHFHGRSVNELKSAFHDCIENYKDYCRKCGKNPEKEYRGSVNVRLKPESHRSAVLEAAQEGISLNQFISEAVDEKIAAAVK